jgi:hypothetical protein
VGLCGSLGLSEKQLNHHITMKTLTEIKAIIQANRQSDAETYAGLDSAEIGKYNGRLMFGDDDQAFPSESEWSQIVD